MEDTSKRVIKVLAEAAGKDPDDVKPEHSFKDDLEFDSLDSVEAVMALEEEFEFEIAEDEANAVDTVAKAIELAEKKLAAGQGK